MKSKVNQERRPGRPPVSEEGASRARMLSEAERLFSERGYSATSLRHISEAAGLNPALVGYHFGSKLGLLEAVFTEALEPLAVELKQLQESDSAPPAELLKLVQRLAIEHPHMLPLLVREALLPGGAMRTVFAERFAPRLGGLFPALLKREQQNGALDPDADPQALTLLLLSIGIFPHVAAGLAEKVIGLNMREGGAERLSAETWRLLERGAGP